MADNRSTFERLVCDGLGYCCPYAFLRTNKQTGHIAIRLGMSDRTVRLWKARFRDKELHCTVQPSCMLSAIRTGGK